ncbi:hypothetical protein E4T56_gene3409 [Termitomyces sp. T112]|nr:hypothetical protein E4T56_gene3409 [Termitomyces sp. T112]
MAKFLDKSGAFTKTGDERAQQPQPTEEDQGNDEGDEQSEERYGLIEGEETDEELTQRLRVPHDASMEVGH